MQITGLEEQDVVQAATVKFPGKYIEMGESNLYLSDAEEDSLMTESVDHLIFTSTHYTYENKLVNGNKTRYKIPLIMVLVKKDKYGVVYDSCGKYYAAYREEEKIHFVPYEDLYELLKSLIHMNEEKNEQAV